LSQAAAIEDRNATRELAVGSDEQRRAYMATLRGTTHQVISLHVQAAPEATNAKQLALTTILNRKGRVLDAMVDSFGALRRRLAHGDQALFDQWRALTARYSAFAVRGPRAQPIHQYREALKDLDDQRQDAENKLSFRSKEIQVASHPVTVDQVAAAIPEGAALVELFRYLPFNVKPANPKEQWGKPRYVAYVLRRGGEITWADLGEAAPIEAAVDQLLPPLHRAVVGFKPAARKLDALVIQPIRRLLGDTRWLFLSPDDVLNLVPFAALVDENGHFLIERYSFSYLASGRDLLQARVRAQSKDGAVVVGAPDFGAGPELATAPAMVPDTIDNANRHERSADMGARVFQPLLLAAEEARAIRARLGNATLLLGPEATEGTVKALHGPHLLHIATHGFFLPDQTPIEVPALDPGSIRAADRFSGGLRYTENALLRSGLALAGANAQKSGRDDGILTALEASQPDLAGTKLVVMSACQTGIGKVESGDGVYGLRRALTIAGAETQVMSLWRVDDQATSNLMQAYYDGLLAGGGRSEALRQVQLAMLNNPDTAHPYYWASFIVSGNPAALDGTPVAPDFAKVPPGPRGCACQLGSGTPAPAGAWWVAMAALAIARMCRSCRGPQRSQPGALLGGTAQRRIHDGS
jgi:CHAT domain-containing protein